MGGAAPPRPHFLSLTKGSQAGEGLWATAQTIKGNDIDFTYPAGNAGRR